MKTKEATQTTDYQKQATDFLSKIGVKMTAKFIKHGKHFEDDQATRDIYRFTLSRDQERFSVRFGQSINESEAKEIPTAYDLLTCLTKSDPGTFEDFYGDFGYDNDSRKAEKIYQAVVQEWQKVTEFFTSEEIEELQDIN